MKWYHGCCVVLVWLLAPGFSSANELENMYSEPKLFQESSRFESFTNKLMSIAIWPSLTAGEQRALADVRIESPTEGHGPMDYYSGMYRGQRFVVLPILSLLFLEDLYTAYAWLWANNYSLETIDEYITMLKYKKAADFPGRRYPLHYRRYRFPGTRLLTLRSMTCP